MKKTEQLLLAGTITLFVNTYLLPDTYWFRLFGLANFAFLYGVLFVFAGLHRRKFAYVIAFIFIVALSLGWVRIEIN